MSVGLELGLEFPAIAGVVGISASVSWSEETGTDEWLEKTCPEGPWKCAMIIWPTLTSVKGTLVPGSSAQDCKSIEDEVYLSPRPLTLVIQ